MKLLPLLAAIAVVYAGCSQKKISEITPPPQNPEVHTVRLRSPELLDAAQDYERESGNVSAYSQIVAARHDKIGTNAFTIFYPGEQGKFFTNWLAHSRPVLFDKFWVHWEGNKPFHHSWIRSESATGMVAITDIFPPNSKRQIVITTDPPTVEDFPSPIYSNFAVALPLPEAAKTIARHAMSLAPAPAQTYGIVLAWDPSLSSNVAYSIYSGPDSMTYTNMLNVGTNLFATITGLISGTSVHFVAVAMDTNGNQSIPSNEVIYNVPVLPPAPPTNLRITTLVAPSVAGPWQPLSNAPPVIVDGTDTNAVYKLQIEKVNQGSIQQELPPRYSILTNGSGAFKWSMPLLPVEGSQPFDSYDAFTNRQDAVESAWRYFEDNNSNYRRKFSEERVGQ